LHPDFIANQKSLGVMHALAGNVPDEYKWALRLLGGMKGSTEQGLRELESVMAHARQQDFVFETEATVMYALLQLHLNNQGEVAWKALKNSKMDAASDPMAAYVLASVAMRTGRNDEAIQYLQHCPAGAQYPPFIARHYLLGLAKLRRLDADAQQPLLQYLQQWKGKAGIKEAYQKLAWHRLLQGDEAAYRSTMSQAKQHGSNKSEGDQAAQREAARGTPPDRRLLRARLLFDGGYYLRAYETLKNTAVHYAADPQHHLEYTYRMGRILQKLGKADEAQRHYQKTIERGAGDKAYFACNAALQLGLLHEERGQPQQAREAYQQCLRLHPDEYASSLHAQAKARLSRLR
ncbi:MAG TPA: tetratricopeptide repeat protein, partial [Saprospiraceae bacterium]|nr:tetratricopeptide repeat protein [Saprospiraceae bacterium]